MLKFAVISIKSMAGCKALVFAFLGLIVLSALTPPSAFAHGDHGGASPPEGGVNLVSFEGFQLELLVSPQPLRAGAENKITIKILRNGSLQPVRNGKVFMTVLPTRLLNGAASPGKAGNSDPPDAPLLFPAPETVWAGNYTLTRELKEKGPYLVRVALEELDGRSFRPPAVFDFRVNVAPGSGLSPGFLFLAFTAFAIGGAGIYRGIVRSRSPLALNVPLNLLDIPWLKRFLSWNGFQPLLQIPVLALTALITLLGLFDIQDGARNLATKVTWILWWPGIIFTFILVGRLWCVMCPFGSLNEWTAHLVKPKRLFPKFLRNLWLPILFFLILTWADEQLGVIRSPQMTAWLILVFAFSAVATGLFFQRRSFCHYLCPITGLLGLYSMVSPLEVRAGDRSQCQKICHQDCYRGNETGKGCPMFEFPMTVDRNTFCNFCFECVKSCPGSNLAFRVRAFGKDLWASGKRWFDESYLSLALVGITTIVTAQMLTGWSGGISWLSRLIPLPIRTLMKPVTYLTITESAIFLMGSLLLFPFFGLLASWMTHRIAGEKEKGVKRIFVVLGYMFVPVGLAMHLAHNLSHLFIEGPGVIPALRRTLNRYTPFNFGDPNWQITPWVSSEVIYWLQTGLILGGLIFSLMAGYRLAAALFDRHEVAGKAVVPFIVLSLLFTLLNLYLLNQPMGMRHAM